MRQPKISRLSRKEFIKIAGVEASAGLLLLLPKNGIHQGNSFYVSNAGLDNNPGTIDKPWKTIARVNVSRLFPGDQVFFKRGETFSGKLTPRNSGNDEFYIIYGAYGKGERPIIDGSASTSALDIKSANYFYLWFENIDFSGSDGTDPTVILRNVHDLYFYDCIIRNSGLDKSGLYIYSTGGAIYDIVFDSCIAHDNYKNGFLAASHYNHDILFTNCTAYNNGHNIYADHGFYIAFGSVIDHCTAYHNASAGFKLNDNGQEPVGYYPILKNSTAYGNRAGITLTHAGATAYNNLIYNNEVNMLVLGNVWGSYKIYYNTFVNSKTVVYDGIVFTNGFSPNAIIKDNLFIQDRTVVAKSILYFNGGGADISDYAISFDYNVYYFDGSTESHIVFDKSDVGNEVKDWTEWRDAGADPHGKLLDNVPDFVARYSNNHPADGGNLKGKGIAITGYEMDKDDHLRSDPPTPGCYENASA